MKETFPKNQQIQNIQELQKPKGERKENHETKGMVKFVIDDKEYELETSSYDFEYPERIQKETGILGYERTKISANNLFEIVKNEASSLLDELGVKTPEEFLKIYECYLIVRYDSNGYYTSRYKHDMDKSVVGIDDMEYEKIENIEKIMININEKIVNLLSDGEYPNLCYTHRIAAYTDRSARMNQQFKEDNFFLQKIYDRKKIEKNNTNYGYGNHGSSCSFYKDNGEILEKYCDLTEINNQSEIKENKAFAAMPNSGLNFWMGDFWGDGERVDNIRSAAFGIPFRSDAFQEEYIKKSLETFCKIEKDELENMSEKNLDDFDKFAGINGAITMYALNEYIKNHPEDIVKYKENGSKWNFKDLVWEESSMKEFGDIIKNFLIDNNITLKNESYNKEGLQWLVNMGEVNLPVFINHKELPQVSWGYAKYAHYANKQGLNFFKLKHADHLP